MKKYENLSMEVIALETEDVIVTSEPGDIPTTPVGEGDGNN